jgi:hypothetical protein
VAVCPRVFPPDSIVKAEIQKRFSEKNLSF